MVWKPLDLIQGQEGGRPGTSESRNGQVEPQNRARERAADARTEDRRDLTAPRPHPGLGAPLPFTPPRPSAKWVWAGRTRESRRRVRNRLGRSGGSRRAPAPLPRLPPGPLRARPPATARCAEPYPKSHPATGGAAVREAAALPPTRAMLSCGRVRPPSSLSFAEPALLRFGQAWQADSRRGRQAVGLVSQRAGRRAGAARGGD